MNHVSHDKLETEMLINRQEAKILKGLLLNPQGNFTNYTSLESSFIPE